MTTSIEGRISVDVSFADKATSSGVESLKMIALADTKTYATGKVAFLSGTLATSVIAVGTSPTTYRNASGDTVSFANVERVVCKATRPCTFGDGGSECAGQTFCMFETTGIPDIDIVPTYSAGTASYTLVIYGT